MPTSRTNGDFDDELLSAYVDGELTAAERAAVDERLRTDERARQLAAGLRAASEAVKSLPRVAVGRDLAAGVLDAIERQHPQVESAAVLAMPQLAEERRAARGRGLVWVAVAVAAALMLMALRPGDERPQQRQLAQSSAEKRLEADESAAGAQSSAMGARGDRMVEGQSDLERSPSASSTTGSTRSGAAPLSGERGQSASEQRALNRPLAAAGDVPAGVEPADIATAAPMRVEGSETLAAASGALLATVEVTIDGDRGVAEFQELLASRGVAISEDPLPTDVVTLLDDALAGGRGEEKETAQAQGDAEPDAFLVEASPEELREVISAINARFGENRGAEGILMNEATDAAGRGGGFGGGGRASGSRAWRLPLRQATDELRAGVAADEADRSALPVAAAEAPSGVRRRERSRQRKLAIGRCFYCGEPATQRVVPNSP